MSTRTIVQKVTWAIKENGPLSMESLLRVLAGEDGLHVVSALFALFNADLAYVEPSGEWDLVRGD